ncbi:hypothetical protein Cadr_000028681 [Camelus dromedarius]|uniref:Uncharacterized protein n=1 Tax=Camelus dromedarius TaxID=9838 RepID=A0A5N4C812_CAMDR|nr:hypothetical protein Cadr_000028681 [Camelus dromedarius]
MTPLVEDSGCFTTMDVHQIHATDVKGWARLPDGDTLSIVIRSHPLLTQTPAPGNAAVPERLEALKYQRIKKPKKSSKGSSKSKRRSDGSASQAQRLPDPQVLWPDEAVCLRRKKRHSRPDPFARLSDLCHRQLPEDQTAILSSVEHDDPGHATLL